MGMAMTMAFRSGGKESGIQSTGQRDARRAGARAVEGRALALSSTLTVTDVLGARGAGVLTSICTGARGAGRISCGGGGASYAGVHGIIDTPAIDLGAAQMACGFQPSECNLRASFGQSGFVCQLPDRRPAPTLIVGPIGQGKQHQLVSWGKRTLPRRGHDFNAHPRPLSNCCWHPTHRVVQGAAALRAALSASPQSAHSQDPASCSAAVSR